MGKKKRGAGGRRENRAQKDAPEKGGTWKSRKAQRKEERKLVKLRRQAYHQGNKVPTLESIAKEKEEKEEAIKAKQLAERQKRRRKEQKKRARRKQQEKEEAEKQAEADGLKEEERQIKKYEKLLNLNKRKSKTIAQGFKNDGLDYLLEAVDPEVLQALQERGEDDVTTDDTMAALSHLEEGDSEDMSEDDEYTETDDVTMDSDQDGDQDGNESNEDTGSEHQPLSGGEDNELSDGSEDYSGYHWPSGEEEEESDSEKMDASSLHTPAPESSVTPVSILKETGAKTKKRNDKSDTSKCVHFQADDSEHSVSNDGGEIVDKLAKRLLKKQQNELDEPPKKKSKRDKHKPDSESSDEQEVNSGLQTEQGTSLEEITAQDASSEKTTKKKKKKRKKKKNKLEDQLVENDEIAESDDVIAAEEEPEETEPEFKEDIYGRLRDASGKVVTSAGAYVPPSKRLAMATSSDEKRQLQLERLKRQLKGQFNRLSESNMQSIAQHIEGLFRQHSRADMTETVTALTMEVCVSVTPVPERLIMEHCMLLAILHSNIGSQIGATVIERLARRLHELLQAGGEYGEGKEVDNLVVCLANLYNFKVIHCVLVFDVMHKFAERFAEKDVDLLLIMLRNVGFTLRKDDPLALKEFIVTIQSRAATDTDPIIQSNAAATGSDDTNLSSRKRFMLEVIMHIKNNNMRKIPHYDPTHLDHLRKLLRNYTGAASGDEQLRISLADLLSAQHRGKWWLVGSAWSGRDTSETGENSDKASAESTAPTVSDKLLELARKQRMNTDVRRNIFCTIMTSEDYVDAFEKLLQLGLKQQQEREIIHVLVDLCLQQKHFNPFYAHLTTRFCHHHRRFQRTVQFDMWDKLKALESVGEARSDRLAQLLTHLITHRALTLAVFKVIEFAELDKTKVNFMKKVLTALLLENSAETVSEIFMRVAGLQKLNMLCEGLKLFLRHFLLRTKSKAEVPDKELLSQRVDLAEQVLDSKGSRLQM